MVGHETLYGISITDEFGYENFKGILEIIEAYKNNDKYPNYPDWITSFPSVEDDQLVIGFSFTLDKHTDFKELESQWQEMYKTVPQDVKDFISSINNSYIGTDVHVVSGYF